MKFAILAATALASAAPVIAQPTPDASAPNVPAVQSTTTTASPPIMATETPQAVSLITPSLPARLPIRMSPRTRRQHFPNYPNFSAYQRKILFGNPSRSRPL